MKCGNAEDMTETQKERKAKAPRKLPRNRPRSTIKQKSVDQSQSSLFARLPSEIRHLIWLETLGGQFLHIARANKRLLAIDCVESDPEFRERWHGCWGGKSANHCFGHVPGFYMGPRSDSSAKPANLLPLLQTCRRIYTETVVIIYKSNIFNINHIDTLLYMERSILRQRLNQTSILYLTCKLTLHEEPYFAPYDIGTWRRACSVLVGLTGLQELTIRLLGGLGDWIEPYEELTGPLMEIKVAKRFDLLLPCSEKGCENFVRGKRFPFRVLSKPCLPLPSPELVNGEKPNMEL
ncbi:hypothetical protein BCON_0084g00300 [Botryotinia convoluta]|uniref:DUF7730 domain-containing protein n=1 Tax=Botryotinia convoluta TaxID=54673 RepID=A0A4Z1I914_9HELO|nr:hypothetical protein BCON_0084g00300 [Botryotinia convoluta]